MAWVEHGFLGCVGRGCDGRDCHECGVLEHEAAAESKAVDTMAGNLPLLGASYEYERFFEDHF